jgi:hypothetical protein
MFLVHELVHALQDQHFDLDRPELDDVDDERGIAFTALVEGDAARIETAWYRQQSLDRQQQIDRMTGGGDRGDFDVVDQLLAFPYYAGPAYVEWLLADGGQPALDAAFTEPPTTTEQVLRPSRLDDVVDVPAPEPEGDVVDAGVLGLLGLHLLFGFDPLEFGGSVDAWAGDAYVTYEQDDVTCTLAHIATDPGQGLEALREDLTGWAAGQTDAEVGDGPAGTLRLRSCVG